VAALFGAVVAVAVLGALWGLGVLGTDAGPAPAAATTIPVATTPPPTTSAAPEATLPTPPRATVPEVPADLAPLPAASDIAATVVPSVVTVQVGGGSGDAFVPRGTGSGVVFDDSGHIVTNDHVVEVGDAYRVVLSDGRIYDADLVGTDPATDLAVLTVTADALRPIALGETDGLAVGDPAIAVGSPLGLEGGPSLSVGVVSALGREVSTDPATTLYGMVQTDAPITQGSSGGALVDGRGRLIGITTAVGVSEVGVEGIGFATPVEIVNRVVAELIADGEAGLPFLGITGSTGFSDTADGGLQPIGVDVETVESGSAADGAGVLAGDVISAVDGRPVDTIDELIALLRRSSGGDVVELTVLREERELTLRATLGTR
jgi:S1-C subfamily serine protease